MTDSSKIRALLSAWIDYLHVENLSNSKVTASDDARPRVWDSGVSLLGDNLLLDESLFKDFKQQLKDPKLQVKGNELLLAVAFPQLYVIEGGCRQFRPLFTVDISTIFSGRHRPRGWNLTELEFQPVIPNLMEWYSLEEEAAENLVTAEGLKVFLETTFNHPFKTLQDFVGLVDLPPSPVRSKPLPYLLNFGYVPFNYNILKDFAKINSQQNWNWATAGHPAVEYLFGQPQPEQHSVTFLGAFASQSATDSQALALKHGQSNPVTAVIGPPGNGKTTLLLHKIAVQVVKGAVQLATTGEYESILTLVTSTNNRAVSNVEELLAPHFPPDRFYLPGGSKELVSTQVIPKLQAALNWLEQETFNQTEWESAKEQLLAGVEQFQSHQEQDELNQRQRIADEQQLEQVNGDIQALERAIEAIQRELQPESSSPGLHDYSQFPLDAYEQIEPHLNSACDSLPPSGYSNAMRGNWFVRLWQRIKRLWQDITRTSSRHVLKRLHKQIEMPVLATLATPFPFQIPLTPESLVAARQTVSQHLDAALLWHQQQRISDSRTRLLESLQQQRDSLNLSHSELQQRLAQYPTTDFYSRFYSELHPLQVQLFSLSWQFLQQEALSRSSEVVASLKTYMGVLNNDWEAYRQLALNWRNVYRDISLLFPVFLSTLHSLRRLFAYPDSGCISLLIVDEAAQIPVHQLFPALVRCRQALVVGDPKQLEPVITLSDQKKDEYRAKAFLARELTDSDYDFYSPTACTAYHRAAGASLAPEDVGNGIILKEHYRCVPAIANLCNHLCNYGMVINTPDKPSKLGANLIACQVEGNYSNNVNWAEIDAVETLIEELLGAGYNFDTIGVISPYRRQASALQARLQSRWADFTSDSIGTVHTFQGGQKSAIVFSTRQCSVGHSLWFLNRKPNLLNVAVSRARELFIVVGNLERLSSGGSYTKQVVEYIEQFGEIRSITRAVKSLRLA